MCLAAKTPSTMAQQKAAITPKLINTIEATSCRREQNQHVYYLAAVAAFGDWLISQRLPAKAEL